MEYEIFGGLVVMEMTLNHVSALMGDNSGLTSYLDNDKLTKPKLIVSSVLSESTLVPTGAVAAGDILININQKNVSTLDEYRAAFIPGEGQRMWTAEVESGGLVVIDYKAALLAEPELALLNRYALSETVKSEIQKLTHQSLPPKSTENEGDSASNPFLQVFAGAQEELSPKAPSDESPRKPPIDDSVPKPDLGKQSAMVKFRQRRHRIKTLNPGLDAPSMCSLLPTHTHESALALATFNVVLRHPLGFPILSRDAS